MVLLDSMVIAEIANFYEHGRKDLKQFTRLAGLRYRLDPADAFESARFEFSLLELGWDPKSGRYSEKRHRRYLEAVTCFLASPPNELADSLSGGDSLANKYASYSGEEVFPLEPLDYTHIVVQMMPTYCIVRKAWELASSSRTWQEQLDVLRDFVNLDLENNSPEAQVVAAALIGGNSPEAGELRGLVRYGGNLSTEEMQRRVRNAAWDLTHLRMLDAIPTMTETVGETEPSQSWLATLDNRIVFMHGFLRRRLTSTGGRAVRIPVARLAVGNRRGQLDEWFEQMDAAVQQRMATQNPDPMSHFGGIVGRCRRYLESVGDGTWDKWLDHFDADWPALN